MFMGEIMPDPTSSLSENIIFWQPFSLTYVYIHYLILFEMLTQAMLKISSLRYQAYAKGGPWDRYHNS